MMMSEFIERTKFEPTAAEYAEIETEYMGCDIDKDKFCKEWVKNGGIQRLSRIRARRIEELKNQLASQQKRSEEYELELNQALTRVRREREMVKMELDDLKRNIKNLLG